MAVTCRRAARGPGRSALLGRWARCSRAVTIALLLVLSTSGSVQVQKDRAMHVPHPPPCPAVL
jgi:hypothetical protein